MKPTLRFLEPSLIERIVAEARGLLAELGITSHLIPKDMPFRPIAEHKRIGRPEYKVLSGTGRVIVVES